MTILQQLIVPNSSTDILTRLRTRFIQVLAIAGIIISALGTFVQLSRNEVQATSIIGIVVSILVLFFIQRRLINLAALALIALATLITLFLPANNNSSLVAAVIAIITAAALLELRLFIFISVILLAKYIIFLAQIPLTSEVPLPIDWNETFSRIIIIAVIGGATRYFIYTTQQAVINSTRNTILLQASAEIGQVLSTMLDIKQLFNRSVELIRDRFGFYHVQVFMVDDLGEEAILIASTGEAGQKLLAQKHKLEVGSGSVVGRVTRFGEPVIARANERDSIHKPNPLLPNTRAELAVPILDGDKVIGALDVQSMLVNAFQPEDVQALQTVGNLLATAIRNARLFEAQNRSVQEQQRLFLESESNLREIQRLNQQLTKAGWVDYVRQSENQSGVTLRDNRIVLDTTWTESLIQASQNHRTVIREANGQPAVVAVPVILRGEVIGAIEVEPGEDTEQSSTIEMVEAVAQRLAISLDNARLFEEAQTATAQEQRINSIVTRYQTATTVDDLLRITLTELSQSLGAQQGAIRLGVAHVNGETAND